MPAPSDLALLCHPTGHCAAVRHFAACASLTADGALQLRYRLTGALEDICLPAPQAPGPADELWRHTCFEAFIAGPEGSDYREFNFSPSGQWAQYAFADYRQRDLRWAATAAPVFSFQQGADSLDLLVTLAPALLPEHRPLRIGLTAVIETRNGDKTYWALAHGAAQPDFHLRQSFTLALNP